MHAHSTSRECKLRTNTNSTVTYQQVGLRQRLDLHLPKRAAVDGPEYAAGILARSLWVTGEAGNQVYQTQTVA